MGSPLVYTTRTANRCLKISPSEADCRAVNLFREYENAKRMKALHCSEQYVVNAMSSYPPALPSATGARNCKCEAHVILNRLPIATASMPVQQKRSQIINMAKAARDEMDRRQFEQFMNNGSKRCKLLVPDLATEWFRKQKICLDSITQEELEELQRDKLEPRSSDDDVYARLMDASYAVAHCLQEQHQREQAMLSWRCRCNQRIDLRRQRPKIPKALPSLTKKSCYCDDPPTPSLAPTPTPTPATTPPRQPEKLHISEKKDGLRRHVRHNGILVCDKQLSKCKESFENIHHATGSRPSTTPRSKGGCELTHMETRDFFIPQKRKWNNGLVPVADGTNCFFQSDGQPLAEECMPFIQPAPGPPCVRRMYNLRRAPQRQYQETSFNRISPEFFTLLKAYEDEMSERYPLYGVPISYWNQLEANCPCDIAAQQRKARGRYMGDDPSLKKRKKAKPPVLSEGETKLDELIKRLEERKERERRQKLIDEGKECNRKVCTRLKEAQEEKTEICTDNTCDTRKLQASTPPTCSYYESGNDTNTNCSCKNDGKAKNSSKEERQSSSKKQKSFFCFKPRRESKSSGKDSKYKSTESKSSDKDSKFKSKESKPADMYCKNRSKENKSAHRESKCARACRGSRADASKQQQQEYKPVCICQKGGRESSATSLNKKPNKRHGLFGLCRKAIEPGRFLLYNLNTINTKYNRQKLPHSNSNNNCTHSWPTSRKQTRRQSLCDCSGFIRRSSESEFDFDSEKSSLARRQSQSADAPKSTFFQSPWHSNPGSKYIQSKKESKSVGKSSIINRIIKLSRSSSRETPLIKSTPSLKPSRVYNQVSNQPKTYNTAEDQMIKSAPPSRIKSPNNQAYSNQPAIFTPAENQMTKSTPSSRTKSPNNQVYNSNQQATFSPAENQLIKSTPSSRIRSPNKQEYNFNEPKTFNPVENKGIKSASSSRNRSPKSQVMKSNRPARRSSGDKQMIQSIQSTSISNTIIQATKRRSREKTRIMNDSNKELMDNQPEQEQEPIASNIRRRSSTPTKRKLIHTKPVPYQRYMSTDSSTTLRPTTSGSNQHGSASSKQSHRSLFSTKPAPCIWTVKGKLPSTAPQLRESQTTDYVSCESYQTNNPQEDKSKMPDNKCVDDQPSSSRKCSTSPIASLQSANDKCSERTIRFCMPCNENKEDRTLNQKTCSQSCPRLTPFLSSSCFCQKQNCGKDMKMMVDKASASLVKAPACSRQPPRLCCGRVSAQATEYMLFMRFVTRSGANTGHFRRRFPCVPRKFKEEIMQPLQALGYPAKLVQGHKPRVQLVDSCDTACCCEAKARPVRHGSAVKIGKKNTPGISKRKQNFSQTRARNESDKGQRQSESVKTKAQTEQPDKTAGNKKAQAKGIEKNNQNNTSCGCSSGHPKKKKETDKKESFTSLSSTKSGTRPKSEAIKNKKNEWVENDEVKKSDTKSQANDDPICNGCKASSCPFLSGSKDNYKTSQHNISKDSNKGNEKDTSCACNSGNRKKYEDGEKASDSNRSATKLVTIPESEAKKNKKKTRAENTLHEGEHSGSKSQSIDDPTCSGCNASSCPILSETKVNYKTSEHTISIASEKSNKKDTSCACNSGNRKKKKESSEKESQSSRNTNKSVALPKSEVSKSKKKDGPENTLTKGKQSVPKSQHTDACTCREREPSEGRNKVRSKTSKHNVSKFNGKSNEKDNEKVNEKGNENTNKRGNEKGHDKGNDKGNAKSISCSCKSGNRKKRNESDDKESVSSRSAAKSVTMPKSEVKNSKKKTRAENSLDEDQQSDSKSQATDAPTCSGCNVNTCPYESRSKISYKTSESHTTSLLSSMANSKEPCRCNYAVKHVNQDSKAQKETYHDTDSSNLYSSRKIKARPFPQNYRSSHNNVPATPSSRESAAKRRTPCTNYNRKQSTFPVASKSSQKKMPTAHCRSHGIPNCNMNKCPDYKGCTSNTTRTQSKRAPKSVENQSSKDETNLCIKNKCPRHRGLVMLAKMEKQATSNANFSKRPSLTSSFRKRSINPTTNRPANRNLSAPKSRYSRAPIMKKSNSNIVAARDCSPASTRDRGPVPARDRNPVSARDRGHGSARDRDPVSARDRGPRSARDPSLVSARDRNAVPPHDPNPASTRDHGPGSARDRSTASSNKQKKDANDVSTRTKSSTAHCRSHAIPNCDLNECPDYKGCTPSTVKSQPNRSSKTVENQSSKDDSQWAPHTNRSQREAVASKAPRATVVERAPHTNRSQIEAVASKAPRATDVEQQRGRKIRRPGNSLSTTDQDSIRSASASGPKAQGQRTYIPKGIFAMPIKNSNYSYETTGQGQSPLANTPCTQSVCSIMNNPSKTDTKSLDYCTDRTCPVMQEISTSNNTAETFESPATFPIEYKLSTCPDPISCKMNMNQGISNRKKRTPARTYVRKQATSNLASNRKSGTHKPSSTSRKRNTVPGADPKCDCKLSNQPRRNQNGNFKKKRSAPERSFSLSELELQQSRTRESAQYDQSYEYVRPKVHERPQVPGATPPNSPSITEYPRQDPYTSNVPSNRASGVCRPDCPGAQMMQNYREDRLQRKMAATWKHQTPDTQETPPFRYQSNPKQHYQTDIPSFYDHPSLATDMKPMPDLPIPNRICPNSAGRRYYTNTQPGTGMQTAANERDCNRSMHVSPSIPALNSNPNSFTYARVPAPPEANGVDMRAARYATNPVHKEGQNAYGRSNKQAPNCKSLSTVGMLSMLGVSYDRPIKKGWRPYIVNEQRSWHPVAQHKHNRTELTTRRSSRSSTRNRSDSPRSCRPCDESHIFEPPTSPRQQHVVDRPERLNREFMGLHPSSSTVINNERQLCYYRYTNSEDGRSQVECFDSPSQGEIVVDENEGIYCMSCNDARSDSRSPPRRMKDSYRSRSGCEMRMHTSSKEDLSGQEYDHCSDIKERMEKRQSVNTQQQINKCLYSRPSVHIITPSLQSIEANRKCFTTPYSSSTCSLELDQVEHSELENSLTNLDIQTIFNRNWQNADKEQQTGTSYQKQKQRECNNRHRVSTQNADYQAEHQSVPQVIHFFDVIEQTEREKQQGLIRRHTKDRRKSTNSISDIRAEVEEAENQPTGPYDTHTTMKRNLPYDQQCAPSSFNHGHEWPQSTATPIKFAEVDASGMPFTTEHRQHESALFRSQTSTNPAVNTTPSCIDIGSPSIYSILKDHQHMENQFNSALNNNSSYINGAQRRYSICTAPQKSYNASSDNLSNCTSPSHDNFYKANNYLSGDRSIASRDAEPEAAGRYRDNRLIHKTQSTLSAFAVPASKSYDYFKETTDGVYNKQSLKTRTAINHTSMPNNGKVNYTSASSPWNPANFFVVMPGDENCASTTAEEAASNKSMDSDRPMLINIESFSRIMPRPVSMITDLDFTTHCLDSRKSTSGQMLQSQQNYAIHTRNHAISPLAMRSKANGSPPASQQYKSTEVAHPYVLPGKELSLSQSMLMEKHAHSMSSRYECSHTCRERNCPYCCHALPATHTHIREGRKESKR